MNYKALNQQRKAQKAYGIEDIYVDKQQEKNQLLNQNTLKIMASIIKFVEKADQEKE